jgi:hypothetical protein
MVFLDKSALDLMIQIMSLKVIVVDILKKKGFVIFFIGLFQSHNQARRFGGISWLARP